MTDPTPDEQHDDALAFVRSVFGTPAATSNEPAPQLTDTDQALANTLQARDIFTNTNTNRSN